ncbi:hypothetical protein [Streptomyces sp. NPDC005303]|uniref:hypothetical protein n=1 Tax=Streptomyces sp. NPDC005303 TaxID=3155713 RepID=UPI0033A790E6
MRPKRLNVRITIPFLGEIGGEWEPDDAERRAAWELYVELVTRVSVAPLGEDEGSAREALTSMHALFATVRDILKRYGPDVAPPGAHNEVSFGVLAITVLNGAIRPVLNKWHPRLTAWENSAPAARSSVEHENTWQEIGALRAALESLRQVLQQLAYVLGDVAGAGDLIATPQNVSALPSQPPAQQGSVVP